MASPKRTSPDAKRASPRPSASRSASVPTADELPVTRAMLGELRTELLERIAQVHDALEARFHEVKAEIHEVKADIHSVKADIHDVKADIHELKAGMARMLLLIEEQNARNRVVLDGLVAVMARQERAERRMDGVEETVRSLASARP